MPKRKAEDLPESRPRRERPNPLVGHARIVEYFHRIGSRGLAHAYLLHGPRGVGKTTFARALALTLHCERPVSFPLGYCGECGACHRGIAGSSGDTVFVDLDFIRLADELAGKEERKTDTYGIETSRLIVNRMQMRSYEGGRLVCIIPNFENVPYGRDEVYNALLKELEEPDEGKLFLLTSERPDRILPTIRSRTLMVRFDPLRDDEVGDALVHQYGEKPARAIALARRAQGSLGDALEQRNEDAAALRESARQWALACLARPGSLPPMPVLGKDEPRVVLDAVLRHARLAVRDVMAFALAGSDPVLDLDSIGDYEKTCAAMGGAVPEKAARALALFDEAGRIAATNVPPATVFGWLQVQLRSAAD